jgi:hypothetical protein
MKSKTFIKLISTSVMMSACIAGASAQGVINTIAGTGTSGFSGDGGPATAAQFSYPSGVAVDNATGSIYIADKNNHRVRMINAMGHVSTVAGNGTMGYTGMGGSALSAAMEYPNSIYVDNSGNYFVSDGYADVAYRIDGGTGNIMNLCGCGSQGSTGDGGPGCFARMCVPNGVFGDIAGNTYIVDVGNNRIRKVDALTGKVNTYTGGPWGFSPSGSMAIGASYSGVGGVCTDNNAVYVSDKGNHVVYRIDAVTGAMRIIAGTPGTAGYSGDGGMALSAKLNMPGALYVHNNFLFICDAAANVVRVVNLSTGVIATLAGNGTMGFSGDGGSPTTARLNQPSAVWEDNAGNIYIADAGNNRIRVISGAAYKGATMVNTVAEGQVSVFPNPSQGDFSVQLSEAPVNGLLEVYNIAGVKVLSQNIDQLQTSVSLSQPTGVYSIKVTSNKGIATQQVTIAK